MAFCPLPTYHQDHLGTYQLYLQLKLSQVHSLGKEHNSFSGQVFRFGLEEHKIQDLSSKWPGHYVTLIHKFCYYFWQKYFFCLVDKMLHLHVCDWSYQSHWRLHYLIQTTILVHKIVSPTSCVLDRVSWCELPHYQPPGQTYDEEMGEDVLTSDTLPFPSSLAWS